MPCAAGRRSVACPPPWARSSAACWSRRAGGWVFLVNVPVGVAALSSAGAGCRMVPGHPSERPRPPRSRAGHRRVAALTFGLVKGSDWGWGSARHRRWTLAASAALIGLFVLHCLRSRTPLVHPSLFRSRSSRGLAGSHLLLRIASARCSCRSCLWEQGAWGWSALRSGLAIAPGPIMVPVMAFLVAGRLIARYGPARSIALGSFLSSAPACRGGRWP